MKISKYMAFGAVAISAMFTSCVGDLDVKPDDPDLTLEPSSKWTVCSPASTMT